MNGVDYSFARPGGAAIKAAGFGFVCRYLASAAGKRITASEVADLQNNELSIVLVFEDNANQALNGYAQGVADAQEALAQANAIGFPADRPIYFAVDFDISDAQKVAAGEYMKGAISVLGLSRVGAYGGYYWIKYCVDNGLASFFWQAVAWSGGQIHPSTHIYQNGNSTMGGQCDIDESKQNDFGQWSLQGVTDMPSTIGDVEARILIKNFYGYTNELDIESAVPGLVGQESNTALRAVDASPSHAAYLQDIANKETAAQQPATPTPSQPTPAPQPQPAPTAPSTPKLSIWQQIINFFTKKG